METTAAHVRWRRVQSVPPPPRAHAADAADHTPVYNELIREWTEAGRAVPDRADPEWNRLTAFRPFRDVPLKERPASAAAGTTASAAR
ncbi:hypothetical protein [Streptomyces sp. GC420]|uniref:hypothetical protein n=1 Tax=Streptomyces sp. GC420 TaxID=2697568 RepID=UPI00141509C2|nr:hypothetical protein [Streptomyces sp. GC420]NBM18241.1 hypothetical protein [Streptomyces sp. GC420]